MSKLIRVGDTILNPEHIICAVRLGELLEVTTTERNWDYAGRDDKVVPHNMTLDFMGAQSDALWRYLCSHSVDVMNLTGEQT